MSAILSHHGSPERFVRVSNDLARHPEMSLKTKGLMLYLLSHKDGWKMSERRLSQALAEGRHAIRTALEEAEEYGYLVRGEQQRDDVGNWGHTVWHTTDDPERYPVEIEECPNRPWYDSPTTEEPTTDGRTTKKTKNKKTTKTEDQTHTRLDSDESDGDESTSVSVAANGGPSTIKEAAEHYEVSIEAAQLTREFAQGVVANEWSLPKRGSKSAERWYIEADRLLRLGEPGDGGHVPDLDEALAVMRWALNDHGNGNGWSGWAANIRSMPTFRKRFNQLRLQMRNGRGGSRKGMDAAERFEEAARRLEDQGR